jgi:hypothetical protein
MDINGPLGDIVFIPEPEKSAGIWNGRLLSVDQLKETHNVDKMYAFFFLLTQFVTINMFSDLFSCRDFTGNMIYFLQDLSEAGALTSILIETKEDAEKFTELDGAKNLGVEVDFENLLRFAPRSPLPVSFS